MKIEKVKVYARCSGDYCAFHEMRITVMYDLTNNIQLGEMTLEELEEIEGEVDYGCTETTTAYLIDGSYYLNID